MFYMLIQKKSIFSYENKAVNNYYETAMRLQERNKRYAPSLCASSMQQVLLFLLLSLREAQLTPTLGILLISSPLCSCTMGP